MYLVMMGKLSVHRSVNDGRLAGIWNGFVCKLLVLLMDLGPRTKSGV